MRRPVALIALALAALGTPTPASAGVELRRPDLRAYPEVTVTAVTSRVTKQAPALTENGSPVAGFTAKNLGRGKSIVLAIDRSQSMRGQALKDATAAARAFVAAKPTADRIAIVAVGQRALRLTRFSGATIDADLALRSIAADGRYGTALYDAVVLSAQSVETGELPGRVLILLTDGQEVSSRASLADAVRAARSAGMAVYPIGIESPKFQPAPLKHLAAETGGSYHAAASTAALKSVYASIAAELRRTWQLRYVTAARPGDELRLAAKAARSGSGTLTVTLPGTTPRSGGSSKVGKGFYQSPAGSLLVGAMVGLMVLLAWWLVSAAKRGSWVRNRIAPHVEGHVAAKRAAGGERFATGVAVMRATENAFGHLQFWRKIHRLLERADLPLRTVELLYIAAGSAFAGALLALVTGRSSLVVLAVFVLFGLAPFGFVWFKARRRLSAFEDQLPDLLMTMAASLKAGHSFKSALQTIVDEGAEPASKEFSRVLAETRLGRPMEDALGELSDRVGSKNLEFVITAVTVQSSVGGSLAGLFDMVADAVRQRQQFARKIKGLTAMGRASAYVLVALPFFLAAALTALNRSYMAPLWYTSQGHKMVIGMLVVMSIGALMLKKIVSFKG